MMITDKDIDQLADEFKEWRKNKKKDVQITYGIGNTPTTIPYQMQYTYPSVSISDTIKDNPYSVLGDIIKRMEGTAEGLRKDGAINYALSLEGEINDLKKLLLGAKD